MSVRAIVAAHGGPALLASAVDAARAQLTDEAAVTAIGLADGAGSAAALRSALERTLQSDAEWVWILEDVTPRAGALAALTDWLDAHPELSPVLLASRVEGPEGELRFFRDWPHYGDIDAVVAAADLRALPLRAAGFHGLLVRTDAVRASGLPLVADDAWRADHEFTARLLAGGPGWLVPKSVVRLSPALPDPELSADLRNQLWTARGPAWSPRERFDRHVQWAVRAIREPDRAAALSALRAGLRRGPR